MTARTVWQGRFLEMRQDGRWEYVVRARDMRAAVIVAIADAHVLLVEQPRVSIGRRCLELPAGLVGDEDADEGVLAAAGRELEEETGYRAARLESLGEYVSSPGMTSEAFTLVRASGLTRVGPGGGVDGEDIVVHRVALTDVSAFVAGKRAAGVAIDVKLLLLLAGDLLS